MPPSVPAGFHEPDFSLSVDVAALVQTLPADGAIKGLYLQSILDQCTGVGRPLAHRSFTAFKDYPLARHIELLVEAAPVLHPGLPVREGLRRIGQSVYPVMASTLLGRVIFGVLGKDIHKLTGLVAKAYQIAGSGLSAELLAAGPDFSHVRLSGHTCLIDSYHVGAFEDVLGFCGLQGVVRFTQVDPTTTELFTRWDAGGR